jgi:kynurenine formamidase
METYDLTHPVESGVQTYPGDPPVEVAPAATMAADGYRVSRLQLGTHAGTHVDAPAHTEPDGATLGAFDAATFRFDARRVDLRDRGPREPVDVERLAGPTDADALVLHTGWDRRWGTDAYVDHPYLTPAAAEWCAVNGLHVAVDAPSVDPTPRPADADTDGDDAGGDESATGVDPAAAPDERDLLAAHHAILGRGRLILENLRGLDALPTRFTLAAYPLAVDADGAPVRAVGLVE